MAFYSMETRNFNTNFVVPAAGVSNNSHKFGLHHPVPNTRFPLHSTYIPTMNEQTINEQQPANEPTVNDQPVNEQPVTDRNVNEQPVSEQHSTPVNISEQAVAKLEEKVTALEAVNYEGLTSFKNFWAEAKSANELLHSSRFLDAEVLSGFRSRVDAVCEKVKAHQDTLSQKSEQVSQAKRAHIEGKVQQAKELLPTDNAKAQKLLRDALACLKDDWSNAKDIQLEEGQIGVRMNRDDHDACWLLWKQVNEECFVHFKEQKQNNYIAISNDVYTLGETVENADPRDALDAIKEFQKKLKGLVLEKTDWEELRTTLNKYWERADQRFKAMKSQFQQGRMHRKEQMERRVEHWKTRQEANIQKFNELISKNFDVITRIEQHMEKLQGDLLAARSEQFKEKVSGWIKEQQEKIAAIQKANRELNEKIADIENKVVKVEEEGLPDRPEHERRKGKANKAQDATASTDSNETSNENSSSTDVNDVTAETRAEEPATEVVEQPVAANESDENETNVQSPV